MSKKVYKKNKKVIEITIYTRKHSDKKLSLSRLFLLVILFFISSIFYYLNVWFPFNNTTSLTIKYIGIQVVKFYTTEKADPDFVPFSVNWQQVLLNQKKPKVVATKKKITPDDQIIWHGSRDKKEIALTFDADMTPIMVDFLHSGEVSTYDDPRITDYLTQHKIKATFFLTGIWIQTYPDATRALAANPLFELENHTYSHPSMAGNCFDQPEVPESQYPSEIEKVQKQLQQIAHITPKYFRFPGGCYTPADLALVKKEGLQTVHWDDVANDGFNDDEEQIIHNVLSEAKNGSIIVMHVGGQPNVPQTANALPTIVDALQKKGYKFVTVSELLAPEPIAQVTPKEYLTSLKSFQTLSP